MNQIRSAPVPYQSDQCTVGKAHTKGRAYGGRQRYTQNLSKVLAHFEQQSEHTRESIHSCPVKYCIMCRVVASGRNQYGMALCAWQQTQITLQQITNVLLSTIITIIIVMVEPILVKPN